MKFHIPVTTLIALALSALSGCATPIETFVDYDKSANIASYKTYTWISNNPMIGSPKMPQAANPFVQRRIQEAIRSRLRASGYQFSPVGSNVDFVVSFSVTARREMSVESYPMAYRGRWRWGGAYIGESVSVEQTTEGMLSIDVFDGASKSPVWHGLAKKKLSRDDEALRSSIIEDVVAEILADFPPATN